MGPFHFRLIDSMKSKPRYCKKDLWLVLSTFGISDCRHFGLATEKTFIGMRLLDIVGPGQTSEVQRGGAQISTAFNSQECFRLSRCCMSTRQEWTSRTFGGFFRDMLWLPAADFAKSHNFAGISGRRKSSTSESGNQSRMQWAIKTWAFGSKPLFYHHIATILRCFCSFGSPVLMILGMSSFGKSQNLQSSKGQILATNPSFFSPDNWGYTFLTFDIFW